MSDERRLDLKRERKILLARRKVEGGLDAADARRLAEIERELERRTPSGQGMRVPDLSDDVTDRRAEPERDTLIAAPVQGNPAQPPRPLAADELFTDSTVGKRERTATGARPLDLAALERKGGRQLLPNDLRGPRRAIVHLVGGVSRRGVLPDPHPDADPVQLEPGGVGDDPPQQIPVSRLETIRLMLPKGMAPPEPRGQRLVVKLRDGKQLEGVSPDYTPDRKAFTLFPSQERYVERIIVYRLAVREVEQLV